MKRSKQAIISFLLSVFMIVSLVGMLPIKNGVRAEDDYSVLNSISFSESSVEKGDNSTLTVNLGVTAAHMGISEIDVTVVPLFGKQIDESNKIKASYRGEAKFGNTISIDLPIPKKALSGEYQIYSVTLCDNNNHSTRYFASRTAYNESTCDLSKGTYVQEAGTFVSNELFYENDSTYSVATPKFTVTGENISVSAPELTDMKMLTEEITPPGKAQVELSVSDPDNDTNYVCVNYFLVDNRVINGITPITVEKKGAPNNGKYVLDFNFGEYAAPGKYQIYSVTLSDKDGNSTYYDLAGFSSGNRAEDVEGQIGTFLEDIGYFVSGELVDREDSDIKLDAPQFKIKGDASAIYPQLISANFVSSTVKRPGVAQLKLKVHDSYGINVATVVLTGLQGKTMGMFEMSGRCDCSPVKDGIITIDIPISESEYLGKYQPMNLSLINVRGFSTDYSVECLSNADKNQVSGLSGTYDESSRAFVSDTLKFGNESIKAPVMTLVDVNDYYLRINIMNPDLITSIQSTPEGKTIGVYVDENSNGILPKAAFDAIKGKDVYLVAYKDSYQWLFYGKDITSTTKDIDLHINVEQVSKDVLNTTEDSVKVEFKPNGILPGKATIRLKSDYLYNLKGIKGNLFLYYNNNGNYELQTNSNFDLDLDGSDKWCNFDITHNSEYIISGSKIGSKEADKTSYSNEWVNGKWYNANGICDYDGILQWKCNSTGWWVEDTAGWYPVSQWQKIDGYWYYFDASGYMASNEYVDGYWLNSDGSCSNDYYLTWKSNSTGWWVEDKSGWWPSSQWLKIDGSWYYFNASGYMVTSQYIDGYWIGADGVCQ